MGYGFSEACGLMLRGRCDVTERGRKIVCKMFGLDPKHLQLADSWNCGSKSDPHVGSIMLSWDMLPALSVFAALETYGIKECYVLYNKDKTWAGTRGFGAESDEQKKEWLDCMAGFGCTFRRFAYEGTAGDRNRHEMSGRVS